MVIDAQTTSREEVFAYVASVESENRKQKLQIESTRCLVRSPGLRAEV